MRHSFWLLLAFSQVAPAQTISTFAGTDVPGFQISIEGLPATGIRLVGPSGVAADPFGNVFIADGRSLIRVNRQGTVNQFFAPVTGGSGHSVASDPAGIISTSGSPLGCISTLPLFNAPWQTIGNCQISGLTDGAGAAARIGMAGAVARTSNGGIVFLDVAGLSLRYVDPSGVLSTLATLAPGVSSSNPPIPGEYGIAVDSKDVIYYSWEELRGGKRGVYRFANGASVQVEPNAGGPIAFDADDNLFFYRPTDGVVYRRTPQGVVNAVAGGGDFVQDGIPPLSARISPVSGLGFDRAGSLYISSWGAVRNESPAGNRVFRVSGVGRSRELCTYSASRPPITLPASGGTYPFQIVVSAPDCGWSVSLRSPAAWLSTGETIRRFGSATISFTAQPNTGQPRSATIAIGNTEITVLQEGQIPALPTPLVSSVVNAARQFALYGAGSFITIYGTNLSAETKTWDGAITNGILPTALGGTSIALGVNRAAYLSYVSPTQINALLPQPLLSTDVYEIRVSNGSSTSAPTVIPAGRNVPSWFTYVVGTTAYIAATFANERTLVAPEEVVPGGGSRPAKAGDIVSFYLTGITQTEPAYPDGLVLTRAYPIAPEVLSTMELTMVARPARILFAGVIAPGLVQINAEVPSGVPAGPGIVSLKVGSQFAQIGAIAFR